MAAYSLTIMNNNTGVVKAFELAEDLDMESLFALIEADFDVSRNEVALFKGNVQIESSSLSLGSAGLSPGDFLLLQRKEPSAQQSSITKPLMDFSKVDFSNINASTTARSSAPSVSGSTELSIASAAVTHADKLIQAVAADSSALAHIDARDPQLAESLRKQQRDVTITLLTQRLQDAKDERIKVEKALRNPLSKEAQELMMNAVKQRNIDEALQHAQEYIPESFGSVFMLYVRIEVNKTVLAAFVDSGAQNTIMSVKCAERCGILRLVDQRFHGIAQGVGTSTIRGRVHVAQVKFGNNYFEASITILEDDKVDLLFGLDLLRRYQCSIDLKKDVLRIGDEELSFLSEAQVREITGKAPFSSPSDTPTSSDTAATTSTTADRQGRVIKLVELGFSSSEAESALAMTDGSVDAAASFLFQRANSLN